MIFAESGKMQQEIQRGNGRLERDIYPSDFHNMEKISLTKCKLMVWTPTPSTILEQWVNGKVGKSLGELRCLVHPVILHYLGLGLAIIKGKALISQDERSFTRQNSWGWATSWRCPERAVAFSESSSITSNHYLHKEIQDACWTNGFRRSF